MFWVPLIGPLIGGVLGALVYDMGIRRYLPVALTALLLSAGTAGRV